MEWEENIPLGRQDLQDWQDFFRLRRGALSAEGRSIQMILLIPSNFLFKIRIHSYSFLF